jgi:hypothetical protein
MGSWTSFLTPGLVLAIVGILEAEIEVKWDGCDFRWQGCLFKDSIRLERAASLHVALRYRLFCALSRSCMVAMMTNLR